MLRRYKWFIDYYKKSYIIAIIALIFEYALKLILPYMIGNVADNIFKQNVTSGNLKANLAVCLLASVCGYLVSIVWNLNVFRGDDMIQYLITTRLYDKYLKQSPEFYDKNSTGSLMGKATNDSNSVGLFVAYGLMSMFDSTFYPFFIVIVMIITTDLRLTLLSILPLPILAIVSNMLGNKLNKAFDESQGSFDKMNDQTLETVSAVRVVRANNLKDFQRNKFSEKANDLYEKNMRTAKLLAWYGPIQKPVEVMTYVLAIGYGSYLVRTGSITVGRLMSFMFYLNLLIWPMIGMGEFISLKKQADASMDRIQEVLDYKEDIVNKKDAVELEESPVIEFRNLSFKYPNSNENVLTDIDFKIEPGKTLGVLGKTGSGKTTLLKQFLRFYDVENGEILFNGRNLTDYTVESVRDKIGYVPQNHMIFSKTIKENIMLTNKNASENELMDAIEMSDFKKDLDKLVNGVDTLCGEKGISLSGGQKQRIALARALIKNPDILILDDCMSAVDGTTEKNILDNFKKIRSGKTNVIATHRISQVKDADEIIVLENGKIVERGDHNSLMENDGWYREQYLRQTVESAYEKECDE
ncbi:ABC transporter ATP-binding protein [uncultured Finegoldia sp.]|uniref:ABC transporter ATP-binding protein n=1 Tax=uncultured Finegoldia sp. TaxID=328009 RepID=UPI0026248DD8|nr:ABC transporter ATP-binding protein [uncultured Finegoldia sp.]